MARKSARKAKPPGAPPRKSLFASESVTGWVQFGALVVGAAAFVWSVYAYFVPPQPGEAVVEGRALAISHSLIEDDFRNLQALHRAIDFVSTYDVNHTNFEDGARTLTSFMAARSIVLKRHELTDAFAEFSVAFEVCRSAPTYENIVQLRKAARMFAEPLDAALQRFVRIASGKPGTQTAQRR